MNHFNLISEQIFGNYFLFNKTIVGNIYISKRYFLN